MATTGPPVVELCERCGRPFDRHGVYHHGPVPEDAQPAVFYGFTGLFCLPPNTID